MYIDVRILQVLAAYLVLGAIYLILKFWVGWKGADSEAKEYVTAALQHMAFEHGWMGFVGVSFGFLLLLLLWPLRLIKDLGILK